jgi:hypothetical protein
MKERYIAEREIATFIQSNEELTTKQVGEALHVPEYLVREVALRLSKEAIYYWISQSGESYRICNEDGDLP